jgi:hypothetical protein
MGSGASFASKSDTSAPADTSPRPAGKPSATSSNPAPHENTLVQKASQIFKGNSAQTLTRKDSNAKNIQEEANSFRSKTGTLKMLIKNKNSRKAFFNFIEKTQKGKEELLDYFLFIESIKKLKDSISGGEPDDARNQFMEVIAQYKTKSMGKEQDAPEMIIFNSTHTWKDIKTLPLVELTKHMTRSQDEVLIAITPTFESFLLSNYYKEFDKNEMANERRSFASSVPVE